MSQADPSRVVGSGGEAVTDYSAPNDRSRRRPDDWGWGTIGDEPVDVANITFLIFTLFSSLRIVSHVPQIHRVAQDGNGASAISYSTWSLWTCANIATALYAAVNLREAYLSAVSGIYAFCCVVVIVLTMLKRRRLRIESTPETTIEPEADPDRTAALEALKGVVDDAAAALMEGGRPAHMFERDAAALVRRIVWRDLVKAVRPRRSRANTARQRSPA
jgi:hypothetical protein